jgi:hypothetical protein
MQRDIAIRARQPRQVGTLRAGPWVVADPGVIPPARTRSHWSIGFRNSWARCVPVDRTHGAYAGQRELEPQAYSRTRIPNGPEHQIGLFFRLGMLRFAAQMGIC